MPHPPSSTARQTSTGIRKATTNAAIMNSTPETLRNRDRLASTSFDGKFAELCVVQSEANVSA